MTGRARPLILAYNAWGRLAFNVSAKHLLASPALSSAVRSKDLHLAPVVNFGKSDVATRAERLAKCLKSVLETCESEKVDLLAFSMAGVDIRLALQENPHLAERVSNLVSIGAPCRGTVLSRVYAHGYLDSSQLEKSNLCTGVHYTDLMETNDEAMERLNAYCEPLPGVTYHYVAGDKAFEDQSEYLRRVARKLLESKVNQDCVFNDGLFFDHEVLEGGNTLKLNADHLDLSPVGLCRAQDAYGHIFKYLQSY